MPRPAPPRFSRFLASLLVPERYRDNHLGDLEEEYADLAGREGIRAANAWFRRQTWSSIPGLVRMRFRGAYPYSKRRGGGGMERVRA